MKSPTELTTLFRDRGMKVTPQRQRVFKALHENQAHPTAEAVHEVVSADMPTISLRTVYQILNDLASMGEIQHLQLGTGSGRFDPNIEPHHHLVCVECGAVVDVVPDGTSVRVPADVAHGFVVDSTEIVFRGTCVQCRQSSQPAAATVAQTIPNKPSIEGEIRRHG